MITALSEWANDPVIVLRFEGWLTLAGIFALLVCAVVIFINWLRNRSGGAR